MRKSIKRKILVWYCRVIASDDAGKTPHWRLYEKERKKALKKDKSEEITLQSLLIPPSIINAIIHT